MGWIKRSWLIGRFKGVEVHLHNSMVLLVPLVFVWFRPTTWSSWLYALAVMVGLFVSVLLHEAGHTIAARLCGIGVSKIMLWPLGGFTHMSRVPDRPFHKLVINAAGPLVNIVLALALLIVWLTSRFFWLLLGVEEPFWIHAVYYVLVYMALLNAALVLFNLLPIHPLDGGRVLNALTEMLFGKSAANTIGIVIGIPILLGLVIFGIVMQDYILLGFCILLALGLGTLDLRSRIWINLGINYLFNRAGYHLLSGGYEEAIRIYTRALAKNPQDVSHLLGRAVAYFGSLAFDLAEADLETILKLQPDHWVALQLRGEIHGFREEYDLALADYSRAKEIKPDYAPPYFGCGDVYLEQKQYERALGEYNRGIELLPQLALGFVARSRAHYRLQDIDAAHRDQAQALRLSPQDGLIMSDANQNAYKGELDWAQDFYGWVLEKYPGQWRAYQGRGDAYVANDQPDAAIVDYSQALELAPKEAILYLRRGVAHQKAGRTSQAADDFRQALVLAHKPHLRRRAEKLLDEVTQANPSVV